MAWSIKVAKSTFKMYFITSTYVIQLHDVSTTKTVQCFNVIDFLNFERLL